jgi:hypothetical protein
MKQRVVTKIGDIFAVKVSDKAKKYFQLIAFDLTQLNSDVIRAFKTRYPIDTDPSPTEIISDDVEFYAHCVTKWGVKLGYWEKIGRSDEVGPLDQILFRDTNDYGHKEGEEPVRISNRWYVWHIGDRDFTRVGKLDGENRKAEIGVVLSPKNILNRIKTGKYLGFYPGFE